VRTVARRGDDARRLVGDPWCAYLLLWTVAPMLFFTVSGNVLPTYVLPGMPVFVLLLCEYWRPNPTDTRAVRFAVRLMIACGVAVIVVFVGVLVSQNRHFDVELSHRALVRMYVATRASDADRLVYVGQRPISAEFYAGGKALKVQDVNALAKYRASPESDFFAIREGDLKAWADADRAGLVQVGKFGEYRLLRETPR